MQLVCRNICIAIGYRTFQWYKLTKLLSLEIKYNMEQNIFNFWWYRKVTLVSLTGLLEWLWDQKSYWTTRIHIKHITHELKHCVYKLWNLTLNCQNTHVKALLDIFVRHLKLLAIKEHQRRTKEAKKKVCKQVPSWLTLVKRLNKNLCWTNLHGCQACCGLNERSCDGCAQKCGPGVLFSI